MDLLQELSAYNIFNGWRSWRQEATLRHLASKHFYHPRLQRRSCCFQNHNAAQVTASPHPPSKGRTWSWAAADTHMCWSPSAPHFVTISLVFSKSQDETSPWQKLNCVLGHQSKRADKVWPSLFSNSDKKQNIEAERGSSIQHRGFIFVSSASFSGIGRFIKSLVIFFPSVHYVSISKSYLQGTNSFYHKHKAFFSLSIPPLPKERFNQISSAEAQNLKQTEKRNVSTGAGEWCGRLLSMAVLLTRLSQATLLTGLAK